MKRVKYYIMNHLLYAKLQIPLARPEKRGRRILEPSPHHQMRERERERDDLDMYVSMIYFQRAEEKNEQLIKQLQTRKNKKMKKREGLRLSQK